MRGEAFTRQLRLLTLLESRGGVAIDEAARELGARRRTVYRDFRVLEDAGIPLASQREGLSARWRVHGDFRHRLQLSLTSSELIALATGRELLSALCGTVFHNSAVSAVEKIRATLPRGLAMRFKATEPLVSAPAGGHDYAARATIVRELVQAVEEHRTIAAVYRSRAISGRERGRAERHLDPYHLHVNGGGIYLLARCHQTDTVKTYLVDRFRQVRLLDDEFEVPKEFRAAEYLKPAFRMWNGRPRKVQFVVAPELGTLLMERKVHPSQVAQRRQDGSVEIRLKVAVGPPLLDYLVGLGANVQDIEPEDLRRKVVEAHEAGVAALRTAVESSAGTHSGFRARGGGRGSDLA